MNRRTIRVLSISGALAATGAIVAGSQGFGSVPVSASASSSSSSPSSSPGTTPGAGSTASSSPASVPATVSSVAVAGSPTQMSYVAGDAATVILDSAGGALRIVAFAPHPGWFTVRLEQPSATQLDVQLESPSGQVHFAAQLANGAVTTQFDVGSAPGSSTPSISAPGGSGPDNSAPGNTAPGGGDDNGGGSGRGGNDDPPGDESGGSGGGGSDDSGSGGRG
jgi:hypothetical protein